MTYGYVRVSTRDQHMDRQIDSLEGFNIPSGNIYSDMQSGKDFERPGYRKLLKRLKRGDLLIVKSVDRFGRNYEEILEQWRIITKEKGVDIKVIDMPLLDTCREDKKLAGTFIADLVLQILAYFAQTEREFCLQRQKEGIAAARARGVHLGRPRKARPTEYQELFNLWNAHLISAREAARRLGVSHKLFLQWAAGDSKMDQRIKN